MYILCTLQVCYFSKKNPQNRLPSKCFVVKDIWLLATMLHDLSFSSSLNVLLHSPSRMLCSFIFRISNVEAAEIPSGSIHLHLTIPEGEWQISILFCHHWCLFLVCLTMATENETCCILSWFKSRSWWHRGGCILTVKPKLVFMAQTGCTSCMDASFAELHCSWIKTQSSLLILVFRDWGTLTGENGVWGVTLPFCKCPFVPRRIWFGALWWAGGPSLQHQKGPAVWSGRCPHLFLLPRLPAGGCIPHHLPRGETACVEFASAKVCW